MAAREDDGRKHHIGIKQGEVGRYVLLPGDPDRVELIASRFDNPKFLMRRREYTTWTGELDGVPVACTSTGIGCPSTAIAVEELADLGVDTFIRVGTSGSMQHHIKPGSVGVISGAIRDEGTSRHYLPLEFPSVADLDVTLALRENPQFGRVALEMPAAALAESIEEQFEALAAAAHASNTRVSYVKPHGALYNTVVSRPDHADAVVQLAARHGVSLFGLNGSMTMKLAESAGVQFVRDRKSTRLNSSH